MRENVFARLTQSIAFTAIGAFLISSSSQTFDNIAIALGIFFIVIGFLTAISAAGQIIPRWIIALETLASLVLYISSVAALIKLAVIDGISGNKLLVIILFIYVIMLPTIQAIRISRSPR